MQDLGLQRQLNLLKNRKLIKEHGFNVVAHEKRSNSYSPLSSGHKFLIEKGGKYMGNDWIKWYNDPNDIPVTKHFVLQEAVIKRLADKIKKGEM